MAQSTENNTVEDPFAPKVRWVIPQRVSHMTFVGPDVVAVAHDVYITFLSLRSGAGADNELVYTANSPERGDGVDVIAGHKSAMFAFAEKVQNARIFIVTYPAFLIVAELKDTEVNRYKGLCLMEGELVAGFSGFPNYVVSLWSWRLGQRLLSLPTGVLRRDQMYMASRTHTMAVQCWGEGLVVWEAAPCYRRCFLLRRAWDGRPPLVAVCWAADGQLLAADGAARLYALASDGIDLVAALEWQEAPPGPHRPALAALGSGVLLYGPDDCVRMLKKTEPSKPKPEPEPTEWHVTWKVQVEEEVERLVANAAGDVAALWTRGGRVYRIAAAPPEPAAAVPVAAASPAGAAAGSGGAGRGGPRAGRSPPLGNRRGRAGAGPAPQSPAAAAAPPPVAVDEILEMSLRFYKQRNIQQVRLIAPAYEHVAALDAAGALLVYAVRSGRAVHAAQLGGEHLALAASPAEPLLAATGAQRESRNYGVALLAWESAGAAQGRLRRVAGHCLTPQHVSRATFSQSGRALLVAAMSAGHVFLYRVSPPPDPRLSLLRYAELGRGLADCCLVRVGEDVRAFCLVLFSDKYRIGERIICINAATGKDNKFAGKMQGPYTKLLPLSGKDTMLAIPHQQHQYHVLRLVGDKGTTVSVKMGPIVEAGHELRQFGGFRSGEWLLTYGADGAVALRAADGVTPPALRVRASHRHGGGVRRAQVDGAATVLVTLAHCGALAVTLLRPGPGGQPGAAPPVPCLPHTVPIGAPGDKTYLDLQEEKKVREEAQDYLEQREEVVKTFKALRSRLVALLEENLAERPLHRLSLSEFNLHLENRRERLKAAERERETIRLSTEARIRAQERVTAWIRATCWDSMLTPRVKLLAMFSHYQVENYPVLPTQRDRWPELQRTAALRQVEMELGAELRPWEQQGPGPGPDPASPRARAPGSAGSLQPDGPQSAPPQPDGAPVAPSHALSGTGTHRFITVPPFSIPQTLAISFLQMNWMQHITKLNVQNMRLWFNKHFDELMATKRREVGMVMERNARLRFIVEELNKLSDLRGSFQHLVIAIRDPQWAMEEQPERLTRVEAAECSVPPWRSRDSLPPPELGPKDDFRERALNDMMDGVLEKLWHEEIKKPIPLPQCMLDKEPEHFNEEDLRHVFDYEAKVKFRNEERDKYRKMLHAEYGKLSGVLNEGIVKFNMKVKDMWLTKLRVDSVIGQESLNLMRLRRVNLDRVEAAEFLEETRAAARRGQREADALQLQLARMEQQGKELQLAYDGLLQRDRQMERGFKNHFSDVSPVVFDTGLKFFRKRPKWIQRATMIPVVLHELAAAVGSGARPPLLHPDCADYCRAVELLDQPANRPAVMDEFAWASVCRLRRAKIELEIRTRGVVQETANVDAAVATWSAALAARRQLLHALAAQQERHRQRLLLTAMNRPVQVCLPAGQVEVVTSGHVSDFRDAGLIPREDIDAINDLILRVGALKLRLMRRQIAFRKVILSKEWEHAQMKMKLRHMRQELYSYQRLKIPKELQLYLKNKEAGCTDEMDVARLEADMAATRAGVETVLRHGAARAEELAARAASVRGRALRLAALAARLRLRLSERRARSDPWQGARRRRWLARRMGWLVERARLVRAVQSGHSRLARLATELELLRLRTYPTLASFHTLD